MTFYYFIKTKKNESSPMFLFTSGDVHINNLAIKGNALDTFNLPFRVVYGHIGSFIARIPWVSLYTSPVCFDISKVFIVCVPNPGKNNFPHFLYI